MASVAPPSRRRFSSPCGGGNAAAVTQNSAGSTLPGSWRIVHNARVLNAKAKVNEHATLKAAAHAPGEQPGGAGGNFVGAIIEAKGLEKFYLRADGGRIPVIAPTDLAIYPDKIVTLLGPSGCGKSTLLRMLTGLARPSAGQGLWHGRPLDGCLPDVSIVFQSFALFPWLTVIENVEAPLEARGVAALERHKKALRILDAVGLDGFETAYPKELSGGMKQRVGFARALVVEPEVLFMDEPFSALDVLTAETLRGELLELWLSRKMPTRASFMVTHTIEEAVELADRIIVLGQNPAAVRADFAVELEHRAVARRHGSSKSWTTFIKSLLSRRWSTPHSGRRSPQERRPRIQCCRTRARLESPACSKCWRVATVVTTSTILPGRW